jgi:hypothetical protein
LAGLAVDPRVVDLLDPPGEQVVHPGQVLDRVQGPGNGELDEELLTDRPEEPFNLSAPRGLAWFRVSKANSEASQCPQQWRGNKGRAVIHV